MRRRAITTGLSAAAAVALAVSEAAAADPTAPRAAAFQALPAPTWTAEFGTRYFFSGGRLQKSLFDPDTRTQLNSRLTYGSTTAHSGEVFGRIDAPSGWFVKGYAGIGWHGGGVLTDEDYPPAEIPYSRTHSKMRNGRLDYGSLDVGTVVWRSAAGRIGLFAGVHHFKEKYHGYGCEQMAANPEVCGDWPIPANVLVLSETARWTSLRLGVVGDLALTDRLSLTAEAAFAPYARFDAFDNHWMRPQINPMAEKGQGFGAQFEASLRYQITGHLSLGAGGRFWHFETTGAKTQFPGAPNPSAESFRSERWGVFVQAAYRAPF